MPPDLLNSREDAILIWAVLLVGLAVWRSDGGLGSSLLAVGRAFFAPKLLLLFGTAAAYCVGLVFLAEQFGLWHSTAVKETIYWFIGTGFVLVGDATQHSPTNPRYRRKLLGHIVRLTIVIDFVVNVYVFPFAVEFFLVPVVFSLVAMQVIGERDPQYASVRKFINGLLVAIGLVLLGYFAGRTATPSRS
jgi:hypothetical protein